MRPLARANRERSDCRIASLSPSPSFSLFLPFVISLSLTSLSFYSHTCSSLFSLTHSFLMSLYRKRSSPLLVFTSFFFFFVAYAPLYFLLLRKKFLEKLSKLIRIVHRSTNFDTSPFSYRDPYSDPTRFLFCTYNNCTYNNFAHLMLFFSQNEERN